MVDAARTARMPEGKDASFKTPASVTVCVTQKVKRGREAAFEAWLDGISAAAKHFPGHQGINVIHRACSQEYTYIFRFATFENLQEWEKSSERDQWIAKLRGLTEIDAKKQILTGLEYWFTLPADPSRPPPARYKMALVTIAAIYPLTTALGYAANPAPVSLIGLLKGLTISVIAVVLMTYVIMPRLTRLLARWLFGNEG